MEQGRLCRNKVAHTLASALGCQVVLGADDLAEWVGVV